MKPPHFTTVSNTKNLVRVYPYIHVVDENTPGIRILLCKVAQQLEDDLLVRKRVLIPHATEERKMGVSGFHFVALRLPVIDQELHVEARVQFVDVLDPVRTDAQHYTQDL
eukprot:CAMPEP_0170190494 /NCGR_PEP_ID=MMETSP0040_2-20121228/49491_1 /TAXON_ID=641309 /ORGANISM="Lotharella oceanica, Strain CCMP622" /LENGTH=109 /DNA_ID=CAMNT_0010438367 /DNA_START=779 /DNA_END=1108 /DNA_ORIENTATION=+